MKVLLDYDPASSQLNEPDTGTFIAAWGGLDRFEHKASEPQTATNELVQLKSAGFTAAEIVELKQAGLI